MSSAARQDEGAPAERGLPARAAEIAAIAARCETLLAWLEADPSPGMAAALDRLGGEVALLNIRSAQLNRALGASAADQAARDALITAGIAIGEARAAAARTVPARRRAPSGHRALSVVPAS